jgi:hypothetical protein
MICLRCGWCCKHMSPISNPNPCPYLSYEGPVAVCSIYDCRPERCAKEDMGGAEVCPIGRQHVEKIGIILNKLPDHVRDVYYREMGLLHMVGARQRDAYVCRGCKRIFKAAPDKCPECGGTDIQYRYVMFPPAELQKFDGDDRYGLEVGLCR